METKNILIICLTIIILVCLGIFLMSHANSQEETHITVLTSQYLTVGDSLKLKLSDKGGNGIANQLIELEIKSDDGTIEDKVTIKTDDKGESQISNLQKGNYNLVAKYNGTGVYKGYTLNYEFVVRAIETVNDDTNTANDTDTDDFATNNTVDDVVNGWDPSEHETYREDLGDGLYRVHYDDGYFRVIDENGNILSYGY